MSLRFLPWAIGGMAVAVGVLAMTNKANAADITDHDALFKKWAARYGIDWRLLKAHAMVESSLDADAINAADPSYGLGQVLCIADSPDSPCRNKFYIDGWQEATPRKLLDPDFNLKMAAQIIAANIRQYGMPRAIAVYNSFDQRNAPLAGPFKNQSYVDKVLAVYRELGGDNG